MKKNAQCKFSCIYYSVQKTAVLRVHSYHRRVITRSCLSWSSHPYPLGPGEDNVTSLCPLSPFLLAHSYFIILISSLLKIKDTTGGIHE